LLEIIYLCNGEEIQLANEQIIVKKSIQKVACLISNWHYVAN